VLAALRRMGYQNNEMTGQKFRSMASTPLHGQDWNRDDTKIAKNNFANIASLRFALQGG
jgi:hypothetical protein